MAAKRVSWLLLSTLSGMAWAVGVGILTARPDPSDSGRVPLETSVPLAGVGGVCGLLLSFLLDGWRVSRTAAAVLVDVVALVVFGAAFGAVFGWLRADGQAANAEHHAALTGPGYLRGLAIGAAFGLALGCLRWMPTRFGAEKSS